MVTMVTMYTTYVTEVLNSPVNPDILPKYMLIWSKFPNKLRFFGDLFLSIKSKKSAETYVKRTNKRPD